MQLGRDQLLGSFVLLLLAALLVFLNPSSEATRDEPARDVPFSVEMPGTIAVELTGETGRDGVYFVRKGTTLAGFLVMADVTTAVHMEEAKRFFVFRSASTLTLMQHPPRIELGPMSAQKRLALGIPIDINRATHPELVLVPGIGEKTAEKIIEQRRINGIFRRLDDLMQVKGIKEKRLEKLRKCLCIGC